MDEPSADARRLIRFGVFELDLRSGELRKSGARLNLQQQPLQLLTVLLEQPGELVTREALRKRLWPDDTFVDFEHGLNAAVRRLRDALGDSSQSPRFIETLPRRGYRFVAPVHRDGEPIAAVTRPVRPRWRSAALAVGVVALALAAWFLMKISGRADPAAATPAPSAGPLIRLTTGPHLSTEPALSPDGEWMAYASDRSNEGHLDIWMQRLNGGDPVRLTRDAADDREPAFSADGSRIVFRSEREGGGLYVMPAHSGGEARLLVPGDAHGARFSPDGRWLAYQIGPGRFSTDKASPLLSETYLMPSDGGAPVRVLPGFVSASWPVWSPDGRHLLVTARRGAADAPEWWVVAAGGGTPVRVQDVDVAGGIDTAAGFRFPVRAWSWNAGNRILYSGAFGGDSWNLWEVALAEGTWRATGAPRRLTTGADLHGYASLSRGNQLLFSNATQTVNVWSLPLDANSGRAAGAPRRLPTTATLQWWPSISDDGRRLAFGGHKAGARGIWVTHDLDSGAESLLVPGDPLAPVITTDGSRVAYANPERPGEIYAVPSAGGPPEKLCADCGGIVGVQDWSTDATRLLYVTGSPTAVFVLDLRSGTRRLVLQRPPNDLWQAQFSPDNRWIVVLEPLPTTNRTRLWIARFEDSPTPPDRWVALTGGEHWDDKPRWSPDGNTIYFVSLRDGFWCLWAQRLHPATRQPVGPARPVQHFHDARLSMNNTGFVGLETSLAHDRIVINLGELSGDIWRTQLQP